MFVGGHFFDSASFDPATAIYSNNAYNIFLAKYDPTGKFISSISSTSLADGDAQLLSMSKDSKDNIYLLGQFEGTVKLNGYTFSGDVGIFSTFIAKYDASGNTQ